MRTGRRSVPCFVALLSLTAASPSAYLSLAKTQPALSDKISLLRHCLEDFPRHPKSLTARDHLIMLLTEANRFDEAYREYLLKIAVRQPSTEPDLNLLDLLIKTGRYAEVLRLTATAPNYGHDLLFDEKLFEHRVAALLALGRYQRAREAVDQWLGMYGREGTQETRFATNVQNLQQLRTSLLAIERSQGQTGKALFTSSVPDSLRRWSRRRNVPIVFFMLVPAQGAQQPTSFRIAPFDRQPARFQKLVDEVNLGFEYLSGGAFSLHFAGLHTLYVKASELEQRESPTHLLASRVYVHTLPPLYGLAGRAFVVLVDCRLPSDDEAAYMGDGLIRMAFNKLQTLTLMHEILHGLGASHQDWRILANEGYVFDANDRGLMTFDKGELKDMGLEEKNRVLLDWPYVPVIRLSNDVPDLRSILPR